MQLRMFEAYMNPSQVLRTRNQNTIDLEIYVVKTFSWFA